MEKYKFWTKIRGIPPEDEARGMSGPFWQMYSADSIHWNVYHDRIETPQCDTQNLPMWDELDLEIGELAVLRKLLRVTGMGLVEGKPKTQRGRRKLALGDESGTVLRRVRAQQVEW
ncbi:MAG: hypothetical protein OTJ97_05470 [SAR202 cluster bacterium]|nr:hypothetical protein [SAR202 cluster bacterium]